LFPSAKGKIVVSCGYNASPAQNHLLMIDEIKKLPEDIKAKSLFVFLLSYGGTKEYIHKLEEELNKDNVSYQFLTNTISGNKLATLRKLSDITVNFQETDSFSFSLQEHLYCQNILILASWLSYQEIDNAGIFYIHTNPDSLCNTLCEVINNLSFYKSKCIANKDLIYDLISWHRMSSLWLESYGK
jgi:glycosyltransferase involved in cell wall biosynthesis